MQNGLKCNEERGSCRSTLYSQSSKIKKHMKWDNIKMTSISYKHRSRKASVDNHYLVATLRTPGQQGDVDVLDEGDVAVGLLGDLVLKC